MATKVHFARTQWASGQGFFHSGTVRVGDRSVLYVYDCGSLDPSGLSREITAFRGRHGDEIDLLFLSHFHADHVNGLPDLLAGATVGTTVIPLVPTAERLIVLGHALATDTQITDWYRDLIADPADALRAISGGAEVIEVDPELEEEDEDSLDEPYEPPSPEGLPAGTAAGEHSDGVVLRAGTRSQLSGAGGTQPIWEWDTLVTVFATGKQQAFLDALAKDLGVTRAALDLKISTRAGISDLVRNESTAIEAAYRSVFSDLNLSSLLVYSGPATEMTHQGRTHRTRSTVERGELGAWDVRPGWLGTGDQRMGIRRCVETAKHFEARLGRVGTLALPHHGSRGSFHPGLLAVFGEHRPVCSASVGTGNPYHHPNRHVIIDVASNGNHVVVVTEQEPSRWTESGVSHL